MNCSELFEKFIEFRRFFVCKRTLEKYYPIAKSLEEVYGLTSASTIKKADTLQFIAYLRAQGLAVESVRRKLTYLKACWDWAIECELLEFNPWKNLPKIRETEYFEPCKPFSINEIVKIIEGFNSFPEYRQLTPFIKFLFGTGCRTGEAVGLRWQDVTPDCRKVKISSQLTRGIRKIPKNGKGRTLRLNPYLEKLLSEMRPKNPNPEQLIFTWNGRTIDLGNFRNRPWKKVLERAGVPYRKFYATRHTFISHSLERGVDPVQIGEMCGNSAKVIFTNYASCIKPPQIPDFLNSMES